MSTYYVVGVTNLGAGSERRGERKKTSLADDHHESYQPLSEAAVRTDNVGFAYNDNFETYAI